MPPSDHDWSDDEDDLPPSGVDTDVLLGVPDGPVSDPADITDAAVSRIGGLPAFLPSREPPFSSSICKVCQSPMKLLLQIWCPFEDSPYDRSLYVWGCSCPTCQKKDGSVRAWRGLRYNEKYALKLEKKLAKKAQKENIIKQTTAKPNPFSISISSTSNPFALGNQVFGNTPPPPIKDQDPDSEPEVEAKVQEQEQDHFDSESDSDSERSLIIVTALASTTLSDSPWSSAPSYPPLYLSTTSEYLPPPPKSQQKVSPSTVANVEQEEGLLLDSDGEGKGKKKSWLNEAYENSMEVDAVFDRFTRRVAYESEQCLRYELGGVPLPFAKDQVFDKLFPAPRSSQGKVTVVNKAASTVALSSDTGKRTYAPTEGVVPPCPACGAKRVFECQLMPNLINVLREYDGEKEKQNKKAQITAEERRKALEKVLKESDGMTWGTVMVFSCEKDCCLADEVASRKKKEKESWREEVVLMQWDT